MKKLPQNEIEDIFTYSGYPIGPNNIFQMGLIEQLNIKLGLLPSSSFDDLRLHYRSVTEFFVLSDRMGRIRNYFKVKVN